MNKKIIMSLLLVLLVAISVSAVSAEVIDEAVSDEIISEDAVVDEVASEPIVDEVASEDAVVEDLADSENPTLTDSADATEIQGLIDTTEELYKLTSLVLSTNTRFLPPSLTVALLTFNMPSLTINLLFSFRSKIVLLKCRDGVSSRFGSNF